MATAKQRNAAILTMENIGNENPLTDKEIMAKSGYGEVIQNQPKQVKQSKGFQEVLEEMLPDSKLYKRHNQLLDKKEYHNKVDKNGLVRKVKTDEIDSVAVSKGLDMAYKLKGRYIEQRVITGEVKHEITQDTQNFAEIQAIRLKYEEELKKLLTQPQNE
jgi:hypothetical protein